MTFYEASGLWFHDFLSCSIGSGTLRPYTKGRTLGSVCGVGSAREVDRWQMEFPACSRGSRRFSKVFPSLQDLVAVFQRQRDTANSASQAGSMLIPLPLTPSASTTLEFALLLLTTEELEAASPALHTSSYPQDSIGFTERSQREKWTHSTP